MTQSGLATATLARIYARQGLTEQARQIYQRLLEEAPGDSALEAALAALEAQAAAPAPADLQESSAESQVQLALVGEAMQCSWRVSLPGLNGAQLLLSSAGQLTLRTALFLGEEVVLKDFELSDTTGQHSLDLPVRALFVSAVVGLLTRDERFVAIAHAEHVRVTEP